MTKKNLNPTRVINELTGKSVFFSNAGKEKKQDKEHEKETQNETVTPRRHDVMTPRNHDTMTSPSDNILESVRSVVKNIGRYPMTYRLSKAEKAWLRSVVFEFNDREEIYTSVNEVTRIGIAYLKEDYKKQGSDSILAKVLKKLNS